MAKKDSVIFTLRAYQNGMLFCFILMLIIAVWLITSTTLSYMDIGAGVGVILICSLTARILWSKRSTLANELESL